VSEILDISRAISQARHKDEPVWLASVVAVDGSAYRRPGARMLFGREGKLAGSISGGCIDREVMRTGAWLSQRGPVVRAYDGSLDEDGVGSRSGCGGRLRVLIELVTPELAGVLMLAAEQVTAEERVALCTIVASSSANIAMGQRIVGWRGGRVGQVGDDDAMSTLSLELSSALEAERPRPTNVRLRAGEALIDVIDPPAHCFVFGTGEDVVPVARCARSLGWNVTVCAEGSQFSTHERFVGVATLKVATLPEHITALSHCGRGLAIVMSHDYERDRATLGSLLELETEYIGMLGPGRRTERMLRELGAKQRISKARLGCIYGPAGLHLGAETSAEIALSIVAEARAVLGRARGGFLRDRQASIHETVAPSLLEAEGA
jgi:xanthine/CO dehydrogenase XdhC/CoxF family maturation factor